MDFLNSFFSNIKDKLTNPYFGTLILVLLIHHWDLIFGIFVFDPDHTFNFKRSFVQNYIKDHITFGSLMWDAIIALFYMFIGYVMLILTRSIVLGIEHRVMPFLTQKIVKGNVVLKTVYDDVVRERDEYFQKYEEQRNFVRQYSTTTDDQTEQIKIKDSQIAEYLIKNSESEKEISILNSSNFNLLSSFNKSEEENKRLEVSVSEIREQLLIFKNSNNLYRKLYFDNDSVLHYSNIDYFPKIIKQKFVELLKEETWSIFTSVAHFLENNTGSISSDDLNYLIEKGLAYRTGNNEGLTPIGKIIYFYKENFLSQRNRLLLYN